MTSGFQEQNCQNIYYGIVQKIFGQVEWVVRRTSGYEQFCHTLWHHLAFYPTPIMKNLHILCQVQGPSFDILLSGLVYWYQLFPWQISDPEALFRFSPSWNFPKVCDGNHLPMVMGWHCIVGKSMWVTYAYMLSVHICHRQNRLSISIELGMSMLIPYSTIWWTLGLTQKIPSPPSPLPVFSCGSQSGMRDGLMRLIQQVREA